MDTKERKQNEIKAYDEWAKNLDLSGTKTYAVIGADYPQTNAFAAHILQVRILDVMRYWRATHRIITKNGGAISFYVAGHPYRLRGMRIDGYWLSERAEQIGGIHLRDMLRLALRPESRQLQD